MARKPPPPPDPTERAALVRAQKALKAFRVMQPGLTSYARALSGRPTVRVEVTGGAPHTDGATIFYRPPMALGDDIKHDRSVCDKRDADTLLQLCSACAVREEILASIYHEIAHIAYHSFAPYTDEERARALSFGAVLKGDRFSAKMIERLDQFKRSGASRSFMSLAASMSEFLPGIVNILEDIRIDERMFEARKGVRRMREARARKAFREGVEQADGTVMSWGEAPLNSQFVVGLYVVASEWSLESYFDDDVTAALMDPRIQELARAAKTARSASDVFNTSFEVLVRAKELGFLLEPDDIEEDEPQPEPEDQQSEEKQDRSEEDQESDSSDDDNKSEESSNQESGDTEDEADDDEGAGQGSGEKDHEGDPETEGSTGDRPVEEADDLQEDADRQDMEEDRDAGDPRDEAPADRGAGPEDEGDSDEGDSDGDGTPEEATGEGVERDDADGDDVDEAARDERGDPAGAGEEESVDDEASGGSGDDLEDVDDDTGDGDSSRRPGSGSDDDRDGELDNDEKAEGEGDSSGEEAPVGEDSPPDDAEVPDEGDSSDDPSEPAEPVEDGAGSEPEQFDSGEVDPLDYGDAETAATYIEAVTGHHGDHHAEDSDLVIITEDEEAASAALETAIQQGLYFETPPINVLGVSVKRYDQPDGEDAWRGVNTDNCMFSEAQLKGIGLRGDFDIPESILGPALQATRRVFDDNARAHHVKNLKSGKIRGGSLAKRAPLGDPRLFKKTILPGKRSYAVLIGMDISGSMAFYNGRNMLLAKRAAKAQAEMCHRIGVDFAVYAHTADGTDEEHLMLEMYEIKSFGDRWNDSAKKALDDIGPYAANCDGHTLEFYRKAIERTQATDKIILYYTDGKMPAANYFEELDILEKQIKLCRQQNIALMGVGIRTDSPSKYGMDTVKVDTDEDLSKVVRHLEKKLVGR